jgi:HD superfamily phosphohydrolase
MSLNHQRITDPVHGTINISKVEAAIIDTAVFQRLHNIKQLGTAHLVYPGANYSRFSHSVGVCHVVGKMIEALLLRKGNGHLDTNARREIQKFRLAGLLHDIGHYPFSHAAQHAISKIQNDALKHEKIGGIIVRHDTEIPKVLHEYDIDPEEIISIFSRSKPQHYGNLVASDLDADRIDYLLRTCHFSGLPYGSIDLDYIISQICEDNKGDVCFTFKALRSIDHFLLSRIFDYRQISYHHAVAAYEWLFEDVLRSILPLLHSENVEKYDFSEDGIKKMLSNGRWIKFTDARVIEKIQMELDSSRCFNDPIAAKKARALLQRKTPKMLGEIERFEIEKDRHNGDIESIKQTLEEKKLEWARKFDINHDLWFIWSRDIKLAKVGSHHYSSKCFGVPDKNDIDDFDQTVRLVDKPNGISTRIIDVQRSLTYALSPYNLVIIRVYALLPQNSGDLREQITEQLRKDLPHLGWSD